jgi:hypothetical protein
MVGILISVEENNVYQIDLQDNNPLASAYEAMECRLVDVVRNVKIGNQRYDILVDDEGLFKDNKKPSAKCLDADQVLFGNIIVLNTDEEKGEWYSLSDDDIENINDNIFSLRHNETKELSPILQFHYGDDEDDFDTNAIA